MDFVGGLFGKVKVALKHSPAYALFAKAPVQVVNTVLNFLQALQLPGIRKKVQLQRLFQGNELDGTDAHGSEGDRHLTHAGEEFIGAACKIHAAVAGVGQRRLKFFLKEVLVAQADLYTTCTKTAAP